MTHDFYGEPTLVELLDAVREWLEAEAGSAAGAERSGRHAFDARVAANILAMAARELQLGDEHRRRHAERLAVLGVADDRALAARIRAGVSDAEKSVLHVALRLAVDDRLAVCDPGYGSRR